jgi:hypothetical protein
LSSTEQVNINVEKSVLLPVSEGKELPQLSSPIKEIFSIFSALVYGKHKIKVKRDFYGESISSTRPFLSYVVEKVK